MALGLKEKKIRRISRDLAKKERDRREKRRAEEWGRSRQVKLGEGL